MYQTFPSSKELTKASYVVCVKYVFDLLTYFMCVLYDETFSSSKMIKSLED